MIRDSDIEIRAATCCAAHARIQEMRLDTQYGVTATRAGNPDIVKWNYTFQCTECFTIFLGYIVCLESDGYVLGEFVDTAQPVPAAAMVSTFAKLNL